MVLVARAGRVTIVNSSRWGAETVASAWCKMAVKIAMVGGAGCEGREDHNCG